MPRLGDMVDGDVLVGLGSSGVHSNGFSLVRKVVERSGLSYADPSPFDPTRTLGEALLEPTRIYVKSTMQSIKGGKIKAISHITGGGAYGRWLCLFGLHEGF